MYYDEDLLINEFKSIKLGIYNPNNDYTSGIHTTTWYSDLPNITDRKISPFITESSLNTLPETKRIQEKLSIILDAEVKPIFTLQRKKKLLPLHIDPPDMPAAINIIVGNSGSGVYFKDTDTIYNYKIALLNISKFHCVTEDKEQDRMLVKFCIMNKSYADCRTLLHKESLLQ